MPRRVWDDVRHILVPWGPSSSEMEYLPGMSVAQAHSTMSAAEKRTGDDHRSPSAVCEIQALTHFPAAYGKEHSTAHGVIWRQPLVNKHSALGASR